MTALVAEPARRSVEAGRAAAGFASPATGGAGWRNARPPPSASALPGQTIRPARSSGRRIWAQLRQRGIRPAWEPCGGSEAASHRRRSRRAGAVERHAIELGNTSGGTVPPPAVLAISATVSAAVLVSDSPAIDAVWRWSARSPEPPKGARGEAAGTGPGTCTPALNARAAGCRRASETA